MSARWKKIWKDSLRQALVLCAVLVVLDLMGVNL